MNLDWAEARKGEYDLMIVTCGYEARATFVHGQFAGRADRLTVLDYHCEGMNSYDVNRTRLRAAQGSIWIDLVNHGSAEVIAETIKQQLAGLETDAPARVFVDVSSCSRRVLANVFLALAAPHGRRVILTCAYAISKFYPPPEGELPASISEPVIGDLSGWSDDLSKPPCAIIGLGFEPGRALGSIDYLEVPEVRLFLPEGPDPRFEQAVMVANRLLTDEIGQPLRYDVTDPEDTYQKLASLVFGLLPRFRPIIIPLGPKIFAALAMLLALRLLPQICIWRTSVGSGEEVSDHGASGDVVAFTYEMPTALATAEQALARSVG